MTYTGCSMTLGRATAHKRSQACGPQYKAWCRSDPLLTAKNMSTTLGVTMIPYCSQTCRLHSKPWLIPHNKVVWELAPNTAWSIARLQPRSDILCSVWPAACNTETTRPRGTARALKPHPVTMHPLVIHTSFRIRSQLALQLALRAATGPFRKVVHRPVSCASWLITPRRRTFQEPPAHRRCPRRTCYSLASWATLTRSATWGSSLWCLRGIACHQLDYEAVLMRDVHAQHVM